MSDNERDNDDLSIVEDSEDEDSVYEPETENKDVENINFELEEEVEKKEGDKEDEEEDDEEDEEEDVDDDDDDDDGDIDVDDYDEFVKPTVQKRNKKDKGEIPMTLGEDDDDEEDDDEEDDDYLQKFDSNIQRNIISEYHPELHQHNYEEIEALCKIVRNEMGIIIDPLHKTLAFLTKYEKARILGERAKQINAGGTPFIQVEQSMIDGYLIAMKELEEKKIPFIIKRPIPNGGCEYWKLKDLEILI
jgi:DNA-directed RNA polymerase subunit K/omega